MWATETPPNSAPSLVPATSGGGLTLRTVGSRKALSSLFVAAQPLEVGDFVLAAAGQRAQIRNIFLSVTQGALARYTMIYSHDNEVYLLVILCQLCLPIDCSTLTRLKRAQLHFTSNTHVTLTYRCCPT